MATSLQGVWHLDSRLFVKLSSKCYLPKRSLGELEAALRAMEAEEDAPVMLVPAAAGLTVYWTF